MRLIDADALADRIIATIIVAGSRGESIVVKILNSFLDTVTDLKECPTIEAEPVRHGRWISMVFTDTGKPAGYKCSECGLGARKKFVYCHCGAKMDGGDPHDQA